MGLFEKQINDLNDLLQLFREGKLSAEQIDTQVKIYSQIERRSSQMLKAIALSGKPGRKLFQMIVKTNLMGDGVAIDLGQHQFEDEKIRCPLKDGNAISRDMCLTFSGEEKNMEYCQMCDHYKITQNILMGEE